MEIPNEVKTYNLIGLAMKVHRTLGRGFTEYVYQDAFEVELIENQIPFERESDMTVYYKGHPLKHKYNPDFLCYTNIIVELKAVQGLADEHMAQTINYLKGTGLRLALLINFGEDSLKWRRVILDEQKNKENKIFNYNEL
ncbi:MAG: GxxExxY protein [Bacteroidales bacterium]|nr:GxxExxY protein [Bacteroidales bacterium]